MHGTSEPDVEVDPHVARSRAAGGADPDHEDRPDDERTAADAPSSTGTEQNEQFVGRVAGQDAGYTGETGAESRAGARRRDGNELTGLAKLAYKPIGLFFGLVGGLLAGKVFGIVWKRISDEDETPQPLSDAYSTREVLLAATLQGAIFGLIKTAVDRYGMKGVRRFVRFVEGGRDGPRRPVHRRAEV